MAPATRRVLIVDDSEADREVCCRYLSADPDWHYDCIEAETGAEGLVLARSGPFDCLLLDYRLPDMDALEFLTELAPGGTGPIPATIVLTGQGSEAVAVSLMKAGAQDYLIKGTLSSESLRRAVRYALEKGSLLRHLEQHARELAAVNRGLTQEMERRVAAERSLQTMAADLERLVEVRTAELVRANALKDEFMAAVSHELRTPLNAIVGWAHVLNAAPPSPDLLIKALDTINRNARIQARLIDDLIDWSRVAAGHFDVQDADADLVSVVTGAIEVVAPLAAARDITLHSQLPPIAFTRGDADRLKQATWNILANAVKFTEHGGRIDVRLQLDGTSHVISVRDTGIGIAPEFLPKVFEPFRQADGSPTRSHGGLGLGLALTRQIMELHGGRVTVESEGEGHGTLFCLYVPVRSTSRQSPAQVAVRADAGSALRGRRIMVVDDDRDARDLLDAVLARHGAVVRTFGSVSAAMMELSAAEPEVLLTDIAMPGIDGYALLRHVRGLTEGRPGSLPVIAVTAFAGPAERERALAEGFADHVGKPVDADRLIESVRRALPVARPEVNAEH